MQRPTFYQTHNESLDKFAKLFNETELFENLIMNPIEEETYRDDGVIFDQITNKRIGFDWEIRDRYFKNGHFEKPTLRQFERKIKKPEIDLSIQCDKTETAIIVAWHEDFKKEKPFIQRSITDFDYKEDALVRETPHFKVYRYDQIVQFKAMIQRAFHQNRFDHRIF